MRRAVLVAVIAGLALAAPGCTRIRNNIGYVVDETLVAAVQPGVDNKASVQAALGRPSFASQWDDSAWYYVSRNTQQLAFADPRVEDQSIVIVRFDANGTVQTVERRGKEKIANIDPADDRTRTLGREGGLLRDLFGNIGRVGGAPTGGAGAGGPNGS